MITKEDIIKAVDKKSGNNDDMIFNFRSYGGAMHVGLSARYFKSILFEMFEVGQEEMFECIFCKQRDTCSPINATGKYPCGRASRVEVPNEEQK